ncbi:hypothetical protein nbrc107696_23630 [Gordonia spumicola]|uniref:Lipoprotein n=1 Tax=Gordonia spumicola TaxID=589161 RepID=A0A7I9V9B0_9ACTN|nr:hypothetical protein [Gordonia spumicola]GEE01917.1 hypothetical protein nbrc107696_23630 [Gordonia spumicola]
MRTTLTTVAAAAAVIAGTYLTAGVAEAAAAPEVHVLLNNNGQAKVTVDTHGRTGCTLHATIDGTPAVHPDVPPTLDSGWSDPGHNVLSYRVACPDGTSSPTAYVYGPRNPLNDLRTQFANSTEGVFGS